MSSPACIDLLLNFPQVVVFHTTTSQLRSRFFQNTQACQDCDLLSVDDLVSLVCVLRRQIAEGLFAFFRVRWVVLQSIFTSTTMMAGTRMSKWRLTHRSEMPKGSLKQTSIDLRLQLMLTNASSGHLLTSRSHPLTSKEHKIVNNFHGKTIELQLTFKRWGTCPSWKLARSPLGKS